MGKSQFLKFVQENHSRAVYASGRGASAAGLTAAITYDPAMQEWVLEGGAMVRADQGTCLIDEFDKMETGDQTSVQEAMEQQTISVAKAGICTKVRARCSVVAAANPRYGKYDPHLDFSENITIPPSLLSRFDIQIVMRDEPDRIRDGVMADFVLCSHQKSHPSFKPEDAFEPWTGVSSSV